MTIINCDLVTCKHNSRNTCTNKQIMVTGDFAISSDDTYCSSYERASIDKKFKEEIALEFVALKKSKVKCDVYTCFKNKDNKCIDKSIYIGKGSPRENKLTSITNCESFLM